jgi:hypothetical protein
VLRPGLRRGDTTHFVVDQRLVGMDRRLMATMARRSKRWARFMLCCHQKSVSLNLLARPSDYIPNQAKHGALEMSIARLREGSVRFGQEWPLTCGNVCESSRNRATLLKYEESFIVAIYKRLDRPKPQRICWNGQK